MGFQNVDRVDWIARLASGICVFNSKYSIYHHVRKEISIAKLTVKDNTPEETKGIQEKSKVTQDFLLAI